MKHLVLMFGLILLACSDPQILPESLEAGTKVAHCRYIQSFEFEEHSYIFLRNTWSCSGDQLLHSPNCKCKNKGD